MSFVVPSVPAQPLFFFKTQLEKEIRCIGVTKPFSHDPFGLMQLRLFGIYGFEPSTVLQYHYQTLNKENLPIRNNEEMKEALVYAETCLSKKLKVIVSH